MTGTFNRRQALQLAAAAASSLALPGLELRDGFAVCIAGAPAPDAVARVAPLVRAATASAPDARALARPAWTPPAAGRQQHAVSSTPPPARRKSWSAWHAETSSAGRRSSRLRVLSPMSELGATDLCS